jgi:riboflavin biosynthesis pyrimidine reductase
MFTKVPTQRFIDYCRRKQAAALAACLPGFRTRQQEQAAAAGLVAIGDEWSRRLFDGDFLRSKSADPGLPSVSLTFVQSRDGNTGADNPSTLGGGETDKHLIYEGLSRVDADGVLAGATTAREDTLVFSVWHPQLVDLRRQCGHTRHPAQIVVTARGDLPFDSALMFTEPELRVFIVAPSALAATLRSRLASRHWTTVVDGGEPLSFRSALRTLHRNGLRVISVVGGRQTATTMLREGLVDDLYLTTSPIDGGEPGTPFYQGPPLNLDRVLLKEGQDTEAGVRFEHFRVRHVGGLTARPGPA